MSKNYQKAARGWLYALAVVIAGTCFGASPAQSATCFLPSGECSTGKIGPGPGPTPTPEYCVGYDITEKEYNAKYKNTSCFSCSSPCTKTSGGTFYKCEAINNTTWDDDYNVCCTNGTKYDADDGKCCAGGKCDHPCSGGKQWSSALKDCVCPSSVETDKDGNCCASGQVLDNGVCTTPCEMNPCGDYPYTSDPGNSEYCDLGCGKGMRYKCKDGYTYSGGTCVEQCAASGYTLTSAKDGNCYSCTTCPTNSSKYKCTENVQTGYQLSGSTCTYKCSDYTLTSKKDEHCYSCTPCPYDSSKYKCTESVSSNYQLVNGVCSKKVEKPTITITLEFDGYSSADGGNTSGASYLKFTSAASDSKNYTVNLIIDGEGDNGINYPLTVTKGNWVTYMSSYYQAGDCDVYGDCDANWDTSSHEAASNPESLSVSVNGTTVLSNLKSPSGSALLQLDQFVGKSYETTNYIIKFAEVNCSKYYKSPWVVNGSDNSIKCRAINSGYAPCGEQATCGGTQYVECKAGSQCGNGGGSTGNSCTASTYTASVTCSLSYSTDECCNAFSCSGKGCGTGYYNCVFDVPSCAFSSVSIHVTDSVGQDHIVASAGAGQTTKILNNYKIPGPNTPCEFFASGSSLGKVKGEAVSGQSYTWKCSYTKKK